MNGRHRRQHLPTIDGHFAGLALILLNVFGLVFIGYAAETTAAISDQATTAPDA
ncbi:MULTISPECIES: hypothetical protein [Streptomyces]|uniref:hypothetical protein n=1 Tax=Streptomyces TaxID=1883 RepID=UPI00186ACB2B|nr:MULTISPECIES: hypothetical protein [Streptomyces]